ncbi:cystatin-F [Osmerus mordax]|uniref:cystatin-F n=1 Tax=Osmerus mordax TaxID=8014 RepID=UPI00350E9206
MGLTRDMLLVLFFCAGWNVLGSVTLGHTTRLIPGHPSNISKNDTGLKKAVLAGTYAFNNQSNDLFLFKPSAIDAAQRQIVKGIRYIADVEVTRTVCRKNEHDEDLLNCDFQPDGSLYQTFDCHFEVWVTPWLHLMKTTYFLCRPKTGTT